MSKIFSLLISIFLVMNCVSCFSVKAHAEEPKPFLGIQFKAVTPGQYGYQGPAGILIVKVFPGGSAEKAGLKENDTLVKFNGAPVEGQENYLKLISMQKVGSKAVLSLMRDGVPLEKTVLFQAKDLDLLVPKQPILRIETGRHTADIGGSATDNAGRWLVTVSLDKSLRVWELPSGRPVRTIRPPIGEGDEGALYSVALAPDGGTIACAGWTQFNGGQRTAGSDGYTIYLFDRAQGNMTGRITGLPNFSKLAFSPDGRFLAAALWGGHGLRLYRTSDWSLIGEESHGGDLTSVDFSRDNRLVTTCQDGLIRLYQVGHQAGPMLSGTLDLVATSFAGRPSNAVFSPDGSKVAVSYYTNTGNVSILSGRDLSFIFSPDISSAHSGGILYKFAWSADGRYLFAGGTYQKQVDGEWKFIVRRWSDGGRGGYSDTVAANSNIADLHSLPDGSLAYGACDPAFGLLDPAGKRTLFVPSPKADHRESQENLLVSGDGGRVQFGYEGRGRSPAIFDLPLRNLSEAPSGKGWFGNLFQEEKNAANLKAPVTVVDGLKIESWNNRNSGIQVKVNGVPLTQIQQYEVSRSLAIAPDGDSFCLGTNMSLHRFDRHGNQIWTIPTPGEAFAVNVSGTGSLVVAAYGDGTIRWHRMSDGKELLAFFPHVDRKRWVLWTPEGFFDHSPGGEELIGYHLNRGAKREAEFIPISKLYNVFYRPDLINAAFTGKELTEYASAVDINKLLTGDTLPPRVRLLTPSGRAATHDTTIRAELCDNGGGIGDITLYLNGMPVSISKAGRGVKLVQKASAACSQFEHAITLADGDNEISLMAYNKAMTIESNRDSIKLSYASGNKAKPDLHILTVAVNSYRDGDLRLSYSVPDAKAIAESFKGTGGNLFGQVVVHQLLDAEVTRNGMERAFAEIGKKTSRDDVFVLFVAGHGITGTKDGAYYFLPYDFRYTGEDAVARQGVSMDDFKGYLANVNALKSLILLDTCNSGSFSEAIASRGMVEKTAINKLVRAVGRATIVASSKSQVALEGYEGHGAFTWTVLDGLKGKAADGSGRITINGLATHVEELLPQITFKKWGFEQVPQKSLQGMDFPIGVK